MIWRPNLGRISTKPPKSTPLHESVSLDQSNMKICSRSDLYEFPKDSIDKEIGYISCICPEPPVDGFAPRDSSHRSNYLCQISSQSVKGVNSVGGVENRGSHRQSLSLLTLHCHYCAASDIQLWCTSIYLCVLMNTCIIRNQLNSLNSSTMTWPKLVEWHH